MNFRLKSSLSLLALLALGGCATPYVAPSDPSSARLLLENNNTQHIVNFATFDDGETCQASTVKRITLDSSGNWGIAPAGKHEIRIKPGEPFTLSSSVGTGCEVMITFLPKKDAVYRASFTFREQYCFLTVERAVQDSRTGQRYVPEESARKREPVAGLANGGSSCK
ncbi:hypothetical protein [Duganella sp. Root1480D1]|uniref:hypothetical protein n=1 Tax=Duganella sp. Root1480D1 TaxID=1736471 RepID=UPI0007105843|nr:hypothetical protein [Duganella sp. Root1480D1]KQZ42436.1 hypothetical protein ASD58_23985 [Duganella sp. Root1480D1]